MESTQSSCSASADYYTDQAEKENVQHIVEKEDKKSKTKTPSKLPGITNSNKSSEKMCKEDDKVTTFSRFWSWFLCFVVQVRMSESGKQMTKKNQYTFLINAFNQQVKDFVQKDSKLYAAITDEDRGGTLNEMQLMKTGQKSLWTGQSIDRKAAQLKRDVKKILSEKGLREFLANHLNRTQEQDETTQESKWNGELVFEARSGDEDFTRFYGELKSFIKVAEDELKKEQNTEDSEDYAEEDAEMSTVIGSFVFVCFKYFFVKAEQDDFKKKVSAERNFMASMIFPFDNGLTAISVSRRKLKKLEEQTTTKNIIHGSSRVKQLARLRQVC